MVKIINIKYNNNYDIYIGRGSKWGNPYSNNPNSKAKYIVDTVEEAINAYKYYILIDNPTLFNEAKIELKNKNLGCFCFENCHGNFLLEIANSDKDINYYKEKFMNNE